VALRVSNDAREAQMTSGQFWWLILIISIGCGFWATVGVLERLLKGLNAHRDLMHADARDQLAELRDAAELSRW
jgi:hypothetical protein